MILGSAWRAQIELRGISPDEIRRKDYSTEMFGFNQLNQIAINRA